MRRNPRLKPGPGAVRPRVFRHVRRRRAESCQVRGRRRPVRPQHSLSFSGATEESRRLGPGSRAPCPSHDLETTSVLLRPAKPRPERKGSLMVALQPGPSLAGSSSRQTGRDLARRPAVESGQAGGSREGAQGEDAVLKRGPGAVVLCRRSHFCGSRRSRPNHVCVCVCVSARVHTCALHCTCVHACVCVGEGA